MALAKLVNTQPADGSIAMYSLINLLVSSAGWVAVADSDGATFSSSGVQVTSGASGAHGLGNALAFKVIRSPDSSLYLSLQHSNNAANRNWRIECDTAAPSGGSATQVPTFANPVLISGGGTPASPTMNDEVIGESDASSYWFNAVATTVAPFMFCAWSWADSAVPPGYVSSLIFLDAIQSWTLASGDTFPYVLHAVATGSGNDTANLSALSNPDPLGSTTTPKTWLAKGLGGAGFVQMPMAGLANPVTSAIAPNNVPLNPVTSKYDLFPVTYVRAADAPADPKGFKGESTLFSLRPQTAHVTGDLYTVAATKDNIVLQDLVLNLWGGDTPSGTGTTPATRAGRIFTAPAPDSTPPTVTNISPVAGTVLLPSTVVQCDVTDNLGLLRRSILRLSGPGLPTWEVIHDGSGFAPNYAAGSARTVIGNGFHFSMLRAGGWPSYPTFTAYPIDSSGNEA